MARRSIELGLVLSTLVGLGVACGTDSGAPRKPNASVGGEGGDGAGEAGKETSTGGTAPSGRPRTRVPDNEGGMGGEPPSGEGGEGGNAGDGVVVAVACPGDPGVPPMVAVCGDGFRAASEECDDGNASAADSCTPICQARDSLPLRPPASGEQLLGDGRHPFAAGCAGAALAFTERAACHDDGTCDATRPPPPPPAEGPIGWWHLDGNGNDSSGGNHTLTIEGNVTSAPGRFGLGMKFDGSVGSCMTAPIWNEARLQGTPGLTMLAWVNPGQAMLCASQRAILGRGWDYLTIAGCDFPPAPNVPGLAGDIRAVGEPMMTNLTPFGGGPVVRNGWTFVAVTWDHQDIKQYVNGAFGSARANPGNLNDSDPMFDIGCAVRGSDGARLWSFIGTLDEVVLYNRPLSQSEISAYYERAIAESTAGINLARFDRQGTFRGITPDLDEGSTPAVAANPVVSELGSNAFAAAWTDIDGDGDGLGVALRSVAHDGALGPLVFANETALLAQSDPDLLWAGNSLVAAWVDDSDPLNAPDVKVRKFDVNLQPLGAEESLATTSRHEADVALASFAGSWAAAWRSSADGMETIEVSAGQSRWTVGPFLPGAVGDRPALVELNSQRLLVVFTEGTAPLDGGVADVSRLRGAVLAAPGPTPSFVIAPRVSPYVTDASLGQAQPNALRADNRLYVSWRSSAVASDPLGEEIWLKEIGLTFNGIEPVLDLALNEIPLPRSDTHRTGDQRGAALFSVPILFGTAIAAAWMDYGPFGAGPSAPGPVIEFMPTPVLRAGP